MRRGVLFLGNAIYGFAFLILFVVLLVVFHFGMLAFLKPDANTLYAKVDTSQFTLSALTYLRTPIVLDGKTMTIGDALGLPSLYSLSAVQEATKEVYGDANLCFSVYPGDSAVPLRYCSSAAEEKCQRHKTSLRGISGHATADPFIDPFFVCTKATADVALPQFDGTSLPLTFRFYST